MKKSIYISKEAQGVIGNIGPGDNLSGRINSIIARYHGITRQAMPALAQGEWMLLIDILNGTWKEAEHSSMDVANNLWLEVLDSEPDGMGDKWGVDIAAFSNRLRAMNYAELCAIMEVVCRFWSCDETAEYPSDAAKLKACGARIS